MTRCSPSSFFRFRDGMQETRLHGSTKPVAHSKKEINEQLERTTGQL